MSTNKGTNSRGEHATPPPPPLPSHVHQIMEAFLWSKKNVSRHNKNKQREVQSQILSNIRRSTSSSDSQIEEVQPLIPTNLNGGKQKNDRQISFNNQHHFYHNLESRSQNKQHANAYYEDIEEDIVCCDGGCCHEGSKNLCTIMIWVIVVLFIIDWIISHVPINFDTPQRITPNTSRIKEIDNRYDQIETPAFANSLRVGGERIGTLRKKNLKHE